jgi:hypothetical protein
VRHGQGRGDEHQTEHRERRAALDLGDAPRLGACRREDDGGVGDVLDDARRRCARRDRLQRKEITVDDADGVQCGVQAERRPSDGRQAQPHRVGDLGVV